MTGDRESLIKILVLCTENSKGPDMHPLYNGVCKDMSQVVSSTIWRKGKQKHLWGEK